jgi:hypothetical protein
MKISTEKTITIAFCGPEPIRSKSVIDNKITQQVNVFNYVGCSLSYEGEKDIDVKIYFFFKLQASSTQFLNHQNPKQTRMQVYNTLTLPTLLYGSENWTMKANDKTRITAAEMRIYYKSSKQNL